MTSFPEAALRRQYIDCLRGMGVLIMLLAHTFDAWTANVERSTDAFRRVLVLGGLGAPLFLWLAGIAVVLSGEHALSRSRNRKAATLSVVRRGVEIFILAFIFRIQSFIVTPGNPIVMIFRVDILNVLGPSIAAAGLVWGLSTRRVATALTYTALAASFAMATPIVRMARLPDALPILLRWYIQPAGEYTNFTLFPWAGFVFAGAAGGSFIAAARDCRTETRVQASLAAGGCALIALGFYSASLPSIYRQSSFWTSSPTYFAIRTGIMMLALAATYGLARAVAGGGSLFRPLERLVRMERRSFFIYWIHVELVYGYLAWPIRHRLVLWEATIAWLAFSLVIYWIVLLWESRVAQWRARGSQSPLHSVPVAAVVKQNVFNCNKLEAIVRGGSSPRCAWKSK